MPKVLMMLKVGMGRGVKIFFYAACQNSGFRSTLLRCGIDYKQ